MATSTIKIRAMYSNTFRDFIIPAVASVTVIKTEQSTVWPIGGKSEREAYLMKFQGQQKTYELRFPLYNDDVDRSGGTHSVTVKTPREQEKYILDYIFTYGFTGELYFYYYDSSRYGYTGTHTGANGQTNMMTDSAAAFVLQELDGCVIWNETDDSLANISSNTATTISHTDNLSGGTDNDWDTGDTYTTWEEMVIQDITIREQGGSPNVRECTIRFTIGTTG